MSENSSPFLPTYPVPSICFVRGEGAILFDSNGNRYIDCLAGIACVPAGHSNPAVTKAIEEQAQKLILVSNFFENESAVKLARRLQDISGGGKVFFANSGSEANECAIKLVRKWGGDNRRKIICADGGFHGRTLGSLAATGQPAKWKGFEPLPEGFVHVAFNDLNSFTAAVDDSTCAVLVEPIQGENGIIPGTPEFLKGLRKLCDDRGIKLIFDEVQTGMGRTGKWWAFQAVGVLPDVFTSAKGLGNGLPIGACIALDEELQETFQPGDHGSTFGGGPVPCAAALATIDYLESEGLLDAVEAKAVLFHELIRELPQVTGMRGRGLMLAAILTQPVARQVVADLLKRGVVANAPAEDVVRFLPPLVISADEIKEVCTKFAESLEACSVA